MKSQHKLEMLAHDAPIVRKASTTTASGYTAINNGVSCPSCGGAESRVVDSRGAVVLDVLAVRRRRQCKDCTAKFFTLEFSEAKIDDIRNGAGGPAEAEAIERVVRALRRMALGLA